MANDRNPAPACNPRSALVGTLPQIIARRAFKMAGSLALQRRVSYAPEGKHLQTLAREQGFESAGPRQAFENAFRLGWIDDEGVFAEVVRARNLAVHVYREEAAQALGGQLPAYHAAFVRLVAKLPAVSEPQS